MAAAGFFARLLGKLGWKGLAMGGIGGAGGLLAGSALSGGGITETISSLGDVVWIALGIGIALVVIYALRGRR